MFQDVVFISMGDTQDRIEFNILEPFTDSIGYRSADIYFSAFLPSQMTPVKKSEEFISQSENIGSSMNGAVVVNFILNSLLSGSL